VALKSDAAAEKPKDQLSRDFLGCSIFDFCNNICQEQTAARLLQQFMGARGDLASSSGVIVAVLAYSAKKP
jgi:hypothetical protein